jgi:phosphatidylethanolamine/phosphatidyl-N-methylethanolamine N-methyltransferase
MQIYSKYVSEPPFFQFVQSLKENLLFILHFFRDPLTMGSLFPSSKALANRLVKLMTVSSESKRYLEVGPGTGAVTDSILKKMGPKDTLDIVELDPDLCRGLRQKYGKCNNLRIHQKSIEDFHEENFDGIISSLPLNQFSVEFVENVFRKYLTIMKPSAFLSYYEYKYPKIITSLSERGKRLKKIQSLKTAFGQKHQEKVETVWKNFPPANVRFLRKSPQQPAAV